LRDTFTILEEDVVRAQEGATVSNEVTRLARGHARDGSPIAVSPMAPVWGRATAPAGSTIAATAADVARFVHFLASDNDGPLSVETRRQMATPRIERPMHAARWSGLGWGVCDWGPLTTLEHGGGHNGQAALAQAFPATGTAAAMLTNSAIGGLLYSPVLYTLTFKLNSLSGKTTLREGDGSIDLDALTGTYARRGTVGEEGPRRFVVERVEDGISMGEEEPIERLTPSVFRGAAYTVKFLFLDPSSDKASHAHIGNRTWKRL